MANLTAEVPGFDFDTVRARSRLGSGTKRSAPSTSRRRPDMRRNLYTALISHADGAERLHGRRRRLSRSRQPGAQGQRVHVRVDVLAVGHLSRRAAPDDADPAREADQRRGAVAGRLPRAEPVRHPAHLAVPGHRDVVHDRLSRRAGDRRRLHERHSRIRRRRRPESDGGQREVRPLRTSRRIHAARLRACRQRSSVGVTDGGVCFRRLDHRPDGQGHGTDGHRG